MAGAFGFSFLFASIIFYAFIGFLLSIGADKWLITTLPDYSTVNSGNFITQFLAILSNPFTAYGFLTWLSIGLFITDLYIVITSLIP